MQTLNLHDRGAIERRAAAMATETLVAMVERRELSQLAEAVAMDELARRILGDEIDYGSGARGKMARFLGRASSVFAAFCCAFWLAWVVFAIFS